MASSASVTTTGELQTTLIENGPHLNVIDTPGLFDFSAPGTIGKEIAKCINIAKDGIHAVLLVLTVRSRFSLEELAVVESLKRLFGCKISDYMIVVFTGGDELEDSEKSLDDYLGCDCPEPLTEILAICGNRRVLFDNKTKNVSKKNDQMRQLLVLVNVVLENNGGRPFTEKLNIDEVDSVGIYSDKEISELEKNFKDSYEEQLKTVTEKIETKLSETTCKLEQRLAEEQAAREKAEAMLKKQLADDKAAQKKAEAARVESQKSIAKLRKDLERAKIESQAVRNQPPNFGCTIFCTIIVMVLDVF